jgi:hypothetical protein
MQPPILMGRPPLSAAASFSSSWLRTIVGHWLFPISRTFNGFGGICDSSARPDVIATPANNSATAHVIDFIFIRSFFEKVSGKLQSVQKATGSRS